MESNISNLTYVGPTRLVTSIGASVMFIFFIEGLVGTLWIVASLMTQRRVWNVINVFITSMCLNDLLTLCLVVILIVDSYIWMEWTAGMTMCKLNPEFTVAFTGCSLWHTAFIAIHRYIVVVHNRAYKRMSKRAYVVFVLIASRLIPALCTIPGLNLETSAYNPKLLRCILKPAEKMRIITFTMVQIVAPCVIVLVCYALVFCYVLRLSSHVNNSNMILQREIQITKMFGMIFLMILVGFVPYAVLRNMDRNNIYDGNVYVIVSVFYGIGSCSNPLVYGAMSTEIRRTCATCLREVLQFLHCDSYLPCLSPPIQSDSDMTTYAVTENRSPKEEHKCIKLNGMNGDEGNNV